MIVHSVASASTTADSTPPPEALENVPTPPEIQHQTPVVPEVNENEPMPLVALEFDTYEYQLAEIDTIDDDFIQYDLGGIDTSGVPPYGNFTLGASSSAAPWRLKYATRRASSMPNEMSIGEANEEFLSSPTDDSDLEWRKERNKTSSDDEDSSDLEKYCDKSDTETWFGEYYDSDEAEHMNYKGLSRNENLVDPNSKLPRPENEDIYENGKILLRQWQRFKDHKAFGAVLKDFAIQEGFELRKVKHASHRITSICRAEGCTWRIHASLSPNGRQFIIKTYNPEHKCQCVVKNRIATSGWIAKKLSSTLTKTPDMSLQRMRLELKDHFGIEATNRQLWKARQKAREDGGYDYAHSYGNLRHYAAMIHKTNPGSTAIIQSNLVPVEQNLDDENLEGDNLAAPIMKSQFNRIFICYSSVKTGFLAACRPFFGLDGCHLKGPYKGILLSAVRLDANLHFYPIAYAIVEAENNSSWKWFLDLLRNEIGDTNKCQPWCIMSDRQKGLIEAIADIPDAGHRFCCFHLENNMVKKFGTSHLQGLFWAAAETANFEYFKRIMEQIKEFNHEAHVWLSNIDFKHWTMSKFDPNVKVEHLTNNFVESFNDWIEDHRYKAPIELLEGIRMQQTAMMDARKATADRWEHKLTPKVHVKVQELHKRARFALVTRVGKEEFQVDYDKKRCTVRLNELFCICGQWQVRGIPCIHAAACITTTRADIVNYCSPYFTTERWRKTFEHVIHPIPDESMWPQFDDEELLPPFVRKPPGRPKKHRRRRVAGEERPLPPMLERQPTRMGVSSTKKYKNCHEFGHNSRSCKKPSPCPSQPQAQPTRGRGKGKGKSTGQGRGNAEQTQSSNGPSQPQASPTRGRGRGRGRGEAKAEEGQHHLRFQ